MLSVPLPRASIKRFLYRSLVLLIVSIGSNSCLYACNIPVFRYALERWQSDDCEIIVFHNKKLSDQELAIIDSWEKQTASGGGNSNGEIILVDANELKDKSHRELYGDLQKNGVSLPHVLVRTDVGGGREVNLWHGTLDAAKNFPFFDSPARKEIGRRLLSGHSVVWLMIRSGNKDLDKAAKKSTESQFADLSKNIPLPEGIGLPGSELYSDIPLVLKFSLVEIDANDPKERFLTNLLTGLRNEDVDSGQPLLIPIFGRGRALEVIPADEVTPALMRDLTLFLCGACSCQVKERNPGFDLLTSIDWESELFGGDENRPPDRSAQEGKNRKPILLTIPPGRKRK